jgi:hypothetical protein
MIHSTIKILKGWYAKNPKILIAIMAYMVLQISFYVYHTFSEREVLSSDNELLYSRPYALASYLSVMGVEGIAQSHWFVQAAHRLALSWIRHVPESDRIQYNMVLLVTDPYELLNADAMKLLRNVGWILIKVEPIYGIPSDQSYLLQNHYTHTAQFTKLHLWAFEGYRHIIYLDSDMLVVKDLLHAVHGYSTTADTLVAAHDVDGSDKFNAGFLYLTPSKTQFTKMKQAAFSMKYDTVLQEQSFLNVYWKNHTVFTPSEISQPINSLTERCVVMHFIGINKPWFACPYSTQFREACNEWSSYDMHTT